MTKGKNRISIFEHESIRFDRGEKRITQAQFKALEKHFGKGLPYYSLIHNGVRFNEHVGVIQVGNLVIEVLPKADKNIDNEATWRDLLINMLRKVGAFDIKVTSASNLKIKPNTILDLYFEMFVCEVEYLLHNGLIKKYRKKEGNMTSLKGNLLFNKHIQQNLVHKERFYVRYNNYDVNHQLHHILYKTIILLRQINTNNDLKSRIGSLLLQFPEMPDIKVSESTFAKLAFNRKNQGYKKAIEIAKLLLLRFHPDLDTGRNDVLALMFDMNLLWEQFVLSTLKRSREFDLKSQHQKNFWTPVGGRSRKIIPDITISNGGNNFVIDTKWKIVDRNPSLEDIRQMFAYHHYFKAVRVALLYPGSGDFIAGQFVKIEGQPSDIEMECGLMFSKFEDTIQNWEEQIVADISNWIRPKQKINSSTK